MSGVKSLLNEGSSKSSEWCTSEDPGRNPDLDSVAGGPRYSDNVSLDNPCPNVPTYCSKAQPVDKKHCESTEGYEQLRDFGNSLGQDLNVAEALQSPALQSPETVSNLDDGCQWSHNRNANTLAGNWPIDGLASDLVVTTPDADCSMVEHWIESVNNMLSEESEDFRHGLAAHSGVFPPHGRASSTPAYHPSTSAYQPRVTLPTPSRNDTSLDALDEFHSPVFPLGAQVFRGDHSTTTPLASSFATDNLPLTSQCCFSRDCSAVNSTVPTSSFGQVNSGNANHIDRLNLLVSAQKIVRLPGKYGDVRSAHLKYKTEMCKYFVLHGMCRKNNQCLFAHGEHDLRPKYVGSNFRTKVCLSFRETGVCKYGSRCTYIH